MYVYIVSGVNPTLVAAKSQSTSKTKGSRSFSPAKTQESWQHTDGAESPSRQRLRSSDHQWMVSSKRSNGPRPNDMQSVHAHKQWLKRRCIPPTDVPRPSRANMC